MINSLIQKILEAYPQPTALLNSHEEIIKFNNNFLRLFSLTNRDHLSGKKPREIFKCIFSSSFPKNQDVDHCQNCGSNLNLKEDRTPGQQFSEKCNLKIVGETAPANDFHKMKATMSPLIIKGEQYYLLSITDISNDVKRKILEKIFFHDVINKAGNIVGILDVLNLIGNDHAKRAELYETLKIISLELVNEIKYQRDLSAEENNELTPHFVLTNSLELLQLSKNEMINSEVANEREIMIAASAINQEIITDRILLNRVLINMLKNALEATKCGGKVILGCEPYNQNHFRFWVHNDTLIPYEIQKQLFTTTTSTKGPDRGLGIFSIKIIGEKYLKGKVNFVSTEETGTHFMIDIPLLGNEFHISQ